MPEQRDIFEEIAADAARRARLGLARTRTRLSRASRQAPRRVRGALDTVLIAVLSAVGWVLDRGERATRSARPKPRDTGIVSLAIVLAVGVVIRDTARTAAAATRRGLHSAGTWLDEQRQAGSSTDLRGGGPAAAVRGVLSHRVTRAALGVTAAIAAMTVLATLLVAPVLVAAAQVVSQAHEHVEAIPPLPEVIERPHERSRVFAADGSEIAIWHEENRRIVSLDDIPEVTRQAVLAIEDARFHEHDGVDVRATGRALLANVRAGDVAEGGSTITQQYVKNALLTDDETIERKVIEAMYATELERRWTKEEILEGYLNVAYLGYGVYGVAAAAEFYFGSDVTELELHQSALIAGMLANPTQFDPIERPEQAQARRDLVIRQMLHHDLITEEEAHEAREVDVEIEPRPIPEPDYPFFVEYVKQQLLDDERLGEDRAERAVALFRGGLEIHTTLQPDRQEAALATISDTLGDVDEGPLGAIVSLEPANGAVRALAIGPREFGVCPEEEDGICPSMQVNPLVPGMGGSGRQSGSAFKPILIAAALEAGYSTDWHTEADSGAEIEDCGAPGEPWEPSNYGDADPGTIDMVDAVRDSNNVYHAELIAEIGPGAVVELGERLGFTTELPEVCALALGAADVFPVEMATAFSAFANGGSRCEPMAVTEVIAADGEVLLEQEPECEQVLEESTVATISSLHREVITSGTGTRAAIGRDVAGKTGTTNDHRDAWFVGWVPQLTTVTWVGHDDPQEMRGLLGHPQVTGGTIPASLFREYMFAALDGVDPEPLPSTGLPRADIPDEDEDEDVDNDDDDDGDDD